jgi:hypothetical protein
METLEQFKNIILKEMIKKWSKTKKNNKKHISNTSKIIFRKTKKRVLT